MIGDVISTIQYPIHWLHNHILGYITFYMGMGQNLVPLVNPKIAGKWMFMPLKMYL